MMMPAIDRPTGSASVTPLTAEPERPCAAGQLTTLNGEHPPTGVPGLFAGRARTHALRILLVEDNPDDAVIIEALLEREQGRYSIHHAKRLSDALTLLRGRDFDIVLLDVSLPDGSGLKTVTRAIAGAGNAPVVVITGTDDRELASRALLAGAQDYLVKGEVDGRILMRTMWHAVERQRLLGRIRAAQQRAQRLATHDPLTGLPNRALFFDRLQQAISHAQRSGESVAVLFVDVDEFKAINDELGHTAGDQVLCQVAARLNAAVRRSDTVARLGGDEFTAIVRGRHDALDTARVGVYLLERLQATVSIGGTRVQPSVSIGIAVYPGDAEDADALVRCADLAMYAAKRKGGGCLEFFAAREEAAERVALEDRRHNRS